MIRRITAVVLMIALAGVLVTAPVQAKKKKAKPVAVTYFMNWFNDCTGGGYLSADSIPNPESCALYFPGLGDTHVFPGPSDSPLVLDASQPITVDFVMTHWAQAAADFEVVLTGEIDGEEMEIASGVQTVLAAAGGFKGPLHYDLEPDAALDNATLDSVALRVSWINGVTYSTIDLKSDGTASVVLHGSR